MLSCTARRWRLHADLPCVPHSPTPDTVATSDACGAGHSGRLQPGGLGRTPQWMLGSKEAARTLALCTAMGTHLQKLA